MKLSNITKNLLAGASVVAFTMGASVTDSLAGSHSKGTVLKVASWAGPKHTMNYGVFPWMNNSLKSCSGGSLSLKVEYGLAPPPAMYDTIRDGVADIGWIVHGYTPGKFVTTKLAELPGIPGNAQQISTAFQKTWEKYLSKAKEAKGIQILGSYVHGPGLLNTKKPITSYKQIKGMKLRVGGGVANAIGKALGVAGVNVPAPKVYETIASGVADGVLFPMETMYAFKVAELVKHSFRNPDGMYTTSFALIQSNASYKKLSGAHKKCVDGIRGVGMSAKIGGFWDAADALGEKEALKLGVKITEPSATERAYYKQVTSKIEAEVLAQVAKKGVDGKAALAFFKSQIK
jgi:TRAP-type C4-dicarboxylate transport system substrate-binding protein